MWAHKQDEKAVPASLERLVPEEIEDRGATGLETLSLHVKRYQFAASHVRGDRVLDLACGVGYGTRILADAHPECVEVVGVDLASSAVAYARSQYGGNRIHFEQEDAFSFRDSRGFDTIVSLETIEHLPDPAAIVRRFAELLRPGGRIIASVPVTPSVDVNPHHLHDFTERSFLRLFESQGFRRCEHLLQVQRVSPRAVLLRRGKRMTDIRPNLLAYYLKQPGAFARRLAATFRYGFSNRYRTGVFELSGAAGRTRNS